MTVRFPRSSLEIESVHPSNEKATDTGSGKPPAAQTRENSSFSNVVVSAHPSGRTTTYYN